MTECEYCGHGYDPVATRWRCPSCGYKSHCCEGAACDPQLSPAIGCGDLTEGAAAPFTR